MTPPHSFHHNPLPLLSLPQHVLDAVFAQLSPDTLAVCSLVCRAWQDLPYEHLPTKLVLQSGPQAVGILGAGLHRCRHLTSLWVTSSKDPVWPGCAAALAQQQLPSLRELHIQHSSQTDAAHLAQLQAILQVRAGSLSTSTDMLVSTLLLPVDTPFVAVSLPPPLLPPIHRSSLSVGCTLPSQTRPPCRPCCPCCPSGASPAWSSTCPTWQKAHCSCCCTQPRCRLQL